jgi:hypothetical protein
MPMSLRRDRRRRASGPICGKNLRDRLRRPTGIAFKSVAQGGETRTRSEYFKSFFPNEFMLHLARPI